MSYPAKASPGPPSGVEKALIAIWTQALGAQNITVSDNFFELGGSTPLALDLVEQIRTYLGVDLPANAIVENPTVAGLAQCLQSASRNNDRKAPPHSRKSEYRTSFAQTRIYLQYRIDPDSCAYNLSEVYHLRGSLDRKALEQALLALIQRQESLRTIFHFDEQRGELLQRVVEPPFAIAYQNLESYSGPEQELHYRQLLEAEARRPFVLEVGPLFRALLIALSPEFHILALTAHHIVTDGWSQQVLISELVQLYCALHKGQPSPLPELKMQYGAFAEWQRQWLSGAEWERQANYWQAQLSGAPPVLSLPTDHPRTGAGDSSPAGSHHFLIEEELANRLRSLSRSKGGTLFMALLAAFQVLISRYCFQDDICVGCPIANRTRKETEELVGFFVNTLILRSTIEDNPSFSDFLGRARDTLLEAIDHAEMPFDQIVNILRPERSLGSTPYLQVMIALQNIPGQPPLAGDLIFEPQPLRSLTSKFDLSLTLREQTGEKRAITGLFTFSSLLFDPATIERIANCYLALLTAAVDDAACRVFQLRILPANDQELLMHEWNQSVILPAMASSRTAVREADGEAEEGVAAGDAAVARRESSSTDFELAEALANCRAYILDRYLQLVPPGAAGELCLAGEGVGNFGDRGRQNAAYVTNPFGAGRLYRTGKLAHNLSDSRIELITNAPEKVNGYPRPSDVVGIQSPGLRADVADSPLHSQPSTEVEKILAGIWNKVLGLSNIGVHDNFFEVGGNSFLAIKVATQASQQGIHFTARDLFRYQKIAELAKVVKHVEPDATDSAAEAARTWWPTLPGQRWFFYRNVINPTLWNMAMLLKVDGVVNPHLMRLAVERLVRQHPALRIQFRELEGEWVQYLSEESDASQLRTFDLSRYDPAAQRQELLRIGNELNSSFKFNEGALARFALFHLGEQGTRLFIVAHHLLSDAWSMRVLVSDLAAIYAGLVASGSLGATQREALYLDWALRMHSPAAMAHAMAEQPYWAPRHTVKLPVDFPDGKNLVATADRVHIELSQDESAALITQAHEKYQTSIDVLLLWALAGCMMEWQKQDFAVITMISHGRESEWSHMDLFNSIGHFTMPYPLVLEIPPDTRPEAGVVLVRSRFEAVPNHGIGYGMLQYIHNHKYLNQKVLLQAEGDISFNYLGDTSSSSGQNGIFTMAQEDTGARLDPRGEGPYKQGLFSYIANGKLHGNWWFNRDLYKVQTIESLAAAYLRNLRSLL